ncbi:HDHD5 hydrolase, partial [Formicarius rufipectus]|nr:HDHD5 hydrolase [Formicarius rufipectus]
LGFCQPITIEMLREKHPLLDAVDHDRTPNLLVSVYFCLKALSVVLFGEPVRWETSLQLIIDVLLTNGYPGNPYEHENYPHIPVLACNMDLMWAAEAQSPRFGHGTFMVCLENIYKKITGRDLKYEALMGKPSRLTYQYAEQLIRAQALHRHWRQPIHTLYAPAGAARCPSVLPGAVGHRAQPAGAARCRAVLVCTGLYDPHTAAQPPHGPAGRAFHGHRDFGFDPALVQPDHIVPDVDAAVDLVFQLENFAP